MNPNPQLAFDAIENNDQARLMMSLAKGLDPNVRDASGRTLLIVACQSDNDRHAFVDTLMDRGADPGIVGPNGRTALHELCAKPVRNMQTLQMLLEKEVELNRADGAGQTPLHALAGRGWMEGCEELLNSSPIPKGLCNQRDHAGRTPLLLASEFPALICMLVSYGADPRIEDHHGNSILKMVSDPMALSMISLQVNVLNNADSLRAKSAAQVDPDFADLMGHGKVVLARQFLSRKPVSSYGNLQSIPPHQLR